MRPRDATPLPPPAAAMQPGRGGQAAAVPPTLFNVAQAAQVGGGDYGNCALRSEWSPQALSAHELFPIRNSLGNVCVCVQTFV